MEFSAGRATWLSAAPTGGLAAFLRDLADVAPVLAFFA